MNTVVTSREGILKASRELIQRQGWQGLSIRAVAAACGVSVGSIYNYFDSKADLVGAAVESVWGEIFHLPEDGTVFRDTQACVAWMYERMEQGCRQYPGFSTSTPWASCGRTSRTGSGGCSRPGGTFSTGSAPS